LPNIKVSPKFINAKTKQELMRTLFINQLKRSAVFKMIDIYQELDGSHTAWYYDEVDAPQNLTEIIKQKGIKE
jgi:hypothetical protein